MDDNLKQQLMPAIVVFNLTLVGWMLYRMLTGNMYLGDFFMQALIGAGLGLVTGGITLGLMMLKK